MVDKVTVVFLVIAVTIATLMVLNMWTNAFGQIQDQELATLSMGYDHIHEDEVAKFASNHSVTLERYDVVEWTARTETIEIVFGDVQTDELFEDETADWLGQQGYEMLSYDPYSNGTTFLEFRTM